MLLRWFGEVDDGQGRRENRAREYRVTVPNTNFGSETETLCSRSNGSAFPGREAISSKPRDHEDLKDYGRSVEGFVPVVHLDLARW
jgi:hypothetical protein